MASNELKIIRKCQTAEERIEGMQGREFSDGECCVFIYDAKHPLRFWGKGVSQDMWVSCVDDGVVTQCRRIYAGDESPIVMKHMGDMAIESLERFYVGDVVNVKGNTLVIER